MEINSKTSQLISRQEFSDQVGKSKSTIDRWIKARVISVARVGRTVFIDPTEAIGEIKSQFTVRAVGGTR